MACLLKSSFSSPLGLSLKMSRFWNRKPFLHRSKSKGQHTKSVTVIQYLSLQQLFLSTEGVEAGPCAIPLYTDLCTHFREHSQCGDSWISEASDSFTYLPRPTCFHLIHVNGIVWSSTEAVKLDISSHTLNLDLRKRSRGKTTAKQHKGIKDEEKSVKRQEQWLEMESFT